MVKEQKGVMSKMEKFKKYLAQEIGIEFKACLYFFVILFFYATYRVTDGSLEASIIHLAEMILSTYIMGYMQVLFMRNFDEAERFGVYEAVASLICTLIYTSLSYLFGWLDKKIGVTALFSGYILLAYVCAFLVYKVKREVDTMQLNEELEDFKKKRSNSENSMIGEE